MRVMYSMHSGICTKPHNILMRFSLSDAFVVDFR